MKKDTEHMYLLRFLALGLAIIVIGFDITAFPVALPSITQEFYSSLNHAQWIFNGYALALGVFIITGGKLADLYGRRKTFFIAMFFFVLFLLLGAFSTSMNMLIICRILMGLCTAVVLPAIIGMIFSLVPESKAAIAGGFVIGMSGVGNATGPVLGGVLTDALGWRWILLVNIPIALFAMLVVLKTIVKDAPKTTQEMDYWGVTLLSLSLFSLLFALELIAELNTDHPLIIGLFTLFVVLFFIFLKEEQMAKSKALISPDILKNQTFIAIGGTSILISTIWFAVLLFLPHFFENEWHFTAGQSGVALLPFIISYAIVSFTAGGLYESLGAKWTITLGASLLAVGMLQLSFIQISTPYWQLSIALIAMGVGVGVAYPSIVTAAVQSVSSEHMSLASGVMYLCRVAGGAIGVAMNTCVISLSNSLIEGMRLAFMINMLLALSGVLSCLLFIHVENDVRDGKA
ncbi:MFS transporter [uncultured Shewanella sp.]|uniref:MFS transporter n=1 Tax=uncultured Shewanella sp. TaxID=173975 RepID=UPI0026190F1B|nr:MFS transporter [uncultured Shewanella sp.]